MVDLCRSQDLSVERDDALAYLERLQDGSLGGVFAAQVVEHLPPGPLVRLLELVCAKLRPGGVFVAETMNPLSFVALKNYFADLTHAQPLVPETLVMLARQAGFKSTEVRFLNPPPDEERLRPVALPAEPAFDEARLALEANVARLNEVVFGPQDYALVGRTYRGRSEVGGRCSRPPVAPQQQSSPQQSPPSQQDGRSNAMGYLPSSTMVDEDGSCYIDGRQ